MTRENKVGLVVCGSFLCLVGVVAAVKLREPAAADAPPPNSPPLAMAGVVPNSVDDQNQTPPRPQPSHSAAAPAADPEPPPSPMPAKVDPPAVAPPPTPPPSAPPAPPAAEPPSLPPPPPPPSAPPTASDPPTAPPSAPPAPEPPTPPGPPTPMISDPPPAPPAPLASDPPAPSPPGPPPLPVAQLDPPPPPPTEGPGPAPVSPPAADPDHGKPDGPHGRHDPNHPKPSADGPKNVVAIEPAPPPPPAPIDAPPPTPAPVKPQEPAPLPPSVVKIEPPPPSLVAPPGPESTQSKNVIVIPPAAHPPAPPEPPIPANVIAVAPGTPPPTASAPLVDSWDERIYVCQAGDDFVSIAKSAYPGHGEEYAAALQQYNRNHPRAGDAMRRDGTITPGARIYIPPSPTLEKRHGDAITKPKPVAAGEFGTMQAAFQTSPEPPTYPTYKVLAPGESVLQIADRQLHDSKRWAEIAKLNPGVNPELPVPIGTVLRMPPAGP